MFVLNVARSGHVLLLIRRFPFLFVHRATEPPIFVILYVKVPDVNPHGDRDFFQLNLKYFFEEYLSRNARDFHCSCLKIVERSTKEVLEFLLICGRLPSHEEGQLCCDPSSP